MSDDRFSRLVAAFIILLQNPLFGGSLGYCAPEEVYMKVYNHVRKISLQPVNTGHRASHILIRFIDGRCERISDDMRDRLGEPLLREGRSVRSGFFYEGENETYIEASVENSSSILYDKEIRNKPRTRRTKRNV